MLRPTDEIEDDVAVGVVADLRPVGRGQAADQRQQGGRPGMTLRFGQRLVPGDRGAERVGPAVVDDEPLGGPDDLERPRLALGRGVAPGRDAVPAEDGPDRLGVGAADLGHVEAELEAGSPPVDPGDATAEAAAGQVLAVGRRRERDPRVRVQVVDMVRVDEPVHGGVDRGRGAAAAMEAEVERGDHLVLAFDARVDVDEGAQAIEPKHRKPGLGERAEVAAGTLDPQQIDRQRR